ncbi:MAG TPA: TIGR02679 family protein [Ktedonobacteraceae bacterium]
MENAQKAVEFFTQAGLSRLVDKLYEKYIEVGQVGGQIILQDSTVNERREIASFLGKPLYPDTTIRVRLVDVEKALNHSFNCTLPEVLRACFPDRKLITLPERRSLHAGHQTQFRSALIAIAADLPEESRGRYWLQQGAHGQEWLFSRYKNALLEEQQRQLKHVRYVANILDRLPHPGMPERLALFAQRTSGDPHALDPDRPTGRLFLLALHDLTRKAVQENEPQPLTFDERLEGRGDSLSASDIPSTLTSPQDRIQELELYSNAGLLVDTISSNVAVFNLASATFHNGTPDQLLQAAGARVLILPLRQVFEWEDALPALPDIYVVENPQVFEEIIAALEPDRKSPTVICTSGWPSVAALKLLDLLLNASPRNRLHYSGDFDVKGLQIAAYLLARYPDRCLPWRFDPQSYEAALQYDGIQARESDVSSLNTLPTIFSSLITTMQQKRKWAYQEGIAALLATDMLHNKVD